MIRKKGKLTVKKWMYVVAFSLLAAFLLVFSFSRRQPVAAASYRQPQLNRPELKANKARRRSSVRKVFTGLKSSGEEKIEKLAERFMPEDDIVIEHPAHGTRGDFKLGEVVNVATCESDAVVLGVVKSQVVKLTGDGTFAYTVNEFVVSSVFKDSGISSQQVIKVGRSGGLVKTKGRKVRSVDLSNYPLEIGKEYLLFLNFSERDDSYAVDDVKDVKYTAAGLSLGIVDGKIVSLTDLPLSKALTNGSSAEEVVNASRIAATMPCEGGVK